jgi:hypothetical protein
MCELMGASLSSNDPLPWMHSGMFQISESCYSPTAAVLSGSFSSLRGIDFN